MMNKQSVQCVLHTQTHSYTHTVETNRSAEIYLILKSDFLCSQKTNEFKFLKITFNLQSLYSMLLPAADAYTRPSGTTILKLDVSEVA